MCVDPPFEHKLMRSYPISAKRLSKIVPEPLSTSILFAISEVRSRNCTFAQSSQPALIAYAVRSNVICMKSKILRVRMCVKSDNNLSRDMRFPTMCYVRPAKARTSLRIRAV